MFLKGAVFLSVRTGKIRKAAPMETIRETAVGSELQISVGDSFGSISKGVDGRISPPHPNNVTYNDTSHASRTGNLRRAKRRILPPP